MGVKKEVAQKQKIERLGIQKMNNQGCLMKIVEYNNAMDIVVEFQDKYRARVHCPWSSFESGSIANPSFRLGEKRYNKQGYLMVVIEYNNAHDVLIEFQDEYKTKVRCTWQWFDKGEVNNPIVFEHRLGEKMTNRQGSLMKIVRYGNANDIDVEFLDDFHYRTCNTTYNAFVDGRIRNPYYPDVLNIGMIGSKYPSRVDGSPTKEYQSWSAMLKRCFDKKTKDRCPTYRDVTCCKEWLCFENFYEWLHEQENFDKWLNGDKWALDKDIIYKGNKIYSPETCCLVPYNVNSLFVKCDATRGELPIGVSFDSKNGLYMARCQNPFERKLKTIGRYSTVEEAFYAYKNYKESIIKKIANIEYKKGNITEKCCKAMLAYKIEITD